MWTKTNQAVFKLLPALACVCLLSGCKPPGQKALFDGMRLLEKGRVVEAVGRLETATELLGTNAHAWNYLGIAYHHAGDVTNAMNAYRRALVANPDLMECRLNLGTLFIEQGRPAEARSEFIACTLRRPNAPDGFEKLALAELRLRNLQQAEQNIRKALQFNDGSPGAWNLLGLIQVQQRRTRDAVQSFSSALTRKPGFPPALLNYAIALQQLNDRPGALKLFRQYLELKPSPPDAAAVEQVVRQLESEIAPPRPAPAVAPAVAPTPAAPTVKAPSKAGSNSTSPRPASAPVPSSTLKPVQPESQTGAVRLPTPNPAPTVTTLAPEPEIRAASSPDSKTAAESSAPAVATGARYSYRGAPSTVAGNRAAALPHANEGARQLERKEYAQAVAAYARAAQADPGWYHAHFNHAVAALGAGHVQEALSAGEKALALQPDSADARLNFAIALRRGGYFQDAAVELERLLARNPGDARAHLALANLYAEQLRRPELARAHYLKVLESDPRHPQTSAIHFWLKSNPQR